MNLPTVHRYNITNIHFIVIIVCLVILRVIAFVYVRHHVRS